MPAPVRGIAGQKARRPRIESSAGSKVSPTSSISAIPIASTGPSDWVARKSASSSTSIEKKTVPPAERIAGAVRSVARTIASCLSSVRRSSSRNLETISRQ